VADDYVNEIGAGLRYYFHQTGNLIQGGENNRLGPAGGGYFSSKHVGRRGILHVDCYWQPETEGDDTPDRADLPWRAKSKIEDVTDKAILFNRLHEAPTPSSVPIHCMPATPDLPGDDGKIDDGIHFMWLMLSITAKYLARDPDSDMSLLTYPKNGFEEAICLSGQEYAIGPVDWSTSDNPQGKLHRLRDLTDKNKRLSAIANERGIWVSPLFAECMERYLNMIEGILQY
jgi:hypothetical protein